MSDMNTQTSKVDDRPRAVQNGMSQEEYDTWMFLADKEASDEPYTYKIKQSDLTKFLRKRADRQCRTVAVDDSDLTKPFMKEVEIGKMYTPAQIQQLKEQLLDEVEKRVIGGDVPMPKPGVRQHGKSFAFIANRRKSEQRRTLNKIRKGEGDE